MARPDVWRQIRRFCLECQGNSSPEIQKCRDTECHLWPLRLGKTEQTNLDAKPINAHTTDIMPELTHPSRPLRTVRAHCLSCAGDRKDVRACTAKEACPLWSLRFGVYPSTYKRVKARLAQGKRLSLLE